MNIPDIGHTLKPLLIVLLLPPVPPMLLVGAGALLARWRGRAGQAVALFGMALLWLSTCEGSGQWLTRHLLHAPPALDPVTVYRLQAQSQASGDVAVLVLGGGVRSYVPEYYGSSLQAVTLERLRYGIWLARRLDAPLGFTGGIGWGARSNHVPESTVVARVAKEEFGMPLRWAESRSRDTRENASFSLPLLKAAGVHKLVLVTSQQHMPRALRAFEEAAANDAPGMEVIAAPAGLVADGMSEMLDWCPSDLGFAAVRYAVYEWMGKLAGH